MYELVSVLHGIYEGRSESKERFAIQSYEGWYFNFGNTPLDWIQELLE